MEKDDILKLARLVNGGKATMDEKLRLLRALKIEMDQLSLMLDETK